MRRLLRIAAVLVLLAVVAGGLATWSLLSDRERLTKLLVDTLRAKLALELTLGEPAEIALWPRPGVRLTGITVGAASAATADVPIATARELTAAVPWSTLFGGDVEIAALTIDAPEIDGAALSGWIAAYSGADAGPPAPPRWPRITTPVRIANGRYVGAGTTTIEAIDLELEPLILDQPLSARLALTVHGTRYAADARFRPVETAAGVGLEDVDATLGSTALRGRARYAGALAWSVELDVAGTLPAALVPASLGFDPAARSEGRIALARTGAGHVVGLRGTFAGRKLDASIAFDGRGAGTPALLDAFARNASGTATIDRLDVSGVQLEGIRLEAKPDERSLPRGDRPLGDEP